MTKKSKEIHPKISIVVTAHGEKALLANTLRNVIASAKNLPEKYEIVISLDAPDAETLRYAKLFARDATVVTCDFHSLAKNRNFAIAASGGEAIFFIDGADIVSTNWFADGYRELLARGRRTIVFPEFTHKFDRANELFRQIDYDFARESSRPPMAICGAYSCCLGVWRADFVPFHQEPGFSFEDLAWLEDLAYAKFNFVTAKNTVFFYRTKNPADSVNAQNVALGGVPCKTPFLRWQNIRNFHNVAPSNKIPREIVAREVGVARTIFEKIWIRFVSIVKLLLTRRIVEFLRRAGWKILRTEQRRNAKENARFYEFSGMKIARDVPKIVVEKALEVNQFEPRISQYKNYFAFTRVVEPRENPINKAFIDVNREILHEKNAVVLSASFVRGGTEKVIRNFTRELSQKYGWKIVVFSDHPDFASEAKGAFLPGVELVHLFGILAKYGVNYSDESPEMMQIIMTYLVQNDIKKLVVANTRVGLNLLIKHGKLLREMGVKIWIYTFNEWVEILGEHKVTSDSMVELVPLAAEFADKIVSDNSRSLRLLHEIYGVEKSKLALSHQPTEIAALRPHKKSHDGKIKIMWAGRIHDQKYPEMALKIAKMLPKNYEITMFGDFYCGYDRKKLAESGVKYGGKFNGVAQLSTGEFDVFLYTSTSDGMPNMLLEIASTGLAIVASNVGGIADLIVDGESGFLVEMADAKGYVAAIKRFANDPKLREKLARNARKIVAEKYSVANFEREIAEIYSD